MTVARATSQSVKVKDRLRLSTAPDNDAGVKGKLYDERRRHDKGENKATEDGSHNRSLDTGLWTLFGYVKAYHGPECSNEPGVSPLSLLILFITFL